MKIKKAVFPVAGFGTRFLPATKATPKEMLPIIDKPIIQYAVEEALDAGINEFIFVTHHAKRAIEDHFDENLDLKQRLKNDGKDDLLKLISRVGGNGSKFTFVRQDEPKGLGHAISCAQHLIEQNEYFKAVIALEGSDKLEPYYDLDWLYRPDVHGGMIQAAFVSSQIAPQSPNKFRHETLWHYMQGGPGVFKGDLYFYWHDGDFDDRSGLIDTSKCPVYLLSGEYDCSCTPEKTMETASRIKGAKAKIMQGMGHFPMSENPDLFKSYIYPVLDEILEKL